MSELRSIVSYIQTICVNVDLVWTDDDVDEALIFRQSDVFVIKELIRFIVDHQKIQLVSASSDHIGHSTVVFPFHVYSVNLQQYGVGLCKELLK